MKYSRILSFLIVISPVLGTAQELVLLQSSEINKKARKIKEMMSRDRYVVYSLTALSVVQSLYPWAALYKKGIEVSKKDTAENNATEKGTDKQDAAEKLSLLPSMKAKLNNLYCAQKAVFNHLFCTQEGWISIIQAAVSLGGSIIIARIRDIFIHPDTLYWYMHSHAPYKLTIALMKQQQQALEGKDFLRILYTHLVHQAEALCAYEVYKSKRLDVEEKEIAQRAVCTLFKVQQYWLRRIAACLEADIIDYQELYTILSHYEDEIGLQMNHFAIIEGETLQDRKSVKRLNE